MKGVIVSYTHSSEILVGREVVLEDDGAIRIVAPNGMTHIVEIEHVKGIYPVSNAHNIPTGIDIKDSVKLRQALEVSSGEQWMGQAEVVRRLEAAEKGDRPFPMSPTSATLNLRVGGENLRLTSDQWEALVDALNNEGVETVGRINNLLAVEARR